MMIPYNKIKGVHKNMHFFNSLKRLWNEFFSFKRYKVLSTVQAVFCGIFVIPFVVSFLVACGINFCLCVVFYLITAPISFVHKVVNKEGQEVKHATQFIIYLISWPWLLFQYIMVAGLTGALYCTYFVAMFDGYVASLCGYRFHLSPDEEEIALVANTPLNKKVPGVFIGFNIASLALVLIGAIVLIASIAGAANGTDPTFGIVIAILFLLVPVLWWGVVYFPYILIFFRSKEAPVEVKPAAIEVK